MIQPSVSLSIYEFCHFNPDTENLFLYFFFMTSQKWQNVVHTRYNVSIHVAFPCNLWEYFPMYVSQMEKCPLDENQESTSLPMLLLPLRK